MYSLHLFMWYFGFWFGWADTPYGTESDSGGPRDFFNPEYADKYIGLATGVIIILLISAVMMFVSSKNAKYGKNNKAALVTSLIGTILAFVGPAVYHGYLQREFTNFWVLFDEGIGYFLPIIAGVLGIIATGFNIYAVTLESKAGEIRVTEKYQPPPEQPKVDVQVPSEGTNFCPNCGAKLTGPFCQECGTKAY